jgi:CHAT domain-containing protein
MPGRAVVAASRARTEPTELQRRAGAAYALCAVRPEEARAAALKVIAASADDPEASVVAHRALALALRQLEGATAGLALLRHAIGVADRHGLTRAGAEARMSYAALLADGGKIAAALAECELAARDLPGRSAGPVLAQRALILSRAGRSEEALRDYARALPLLRAAGDVRFLCRLYLNRANVLTYLGRTSAAARDLRAGIDLAQAHGMHELVAMLSGNLGFVMTRTGDVPAALQIFGETLPDAEGTFRLTTTYDRAAALLSVGLAAEARQTLEDVIDQVAAAGFALDVAEWQLMLAHAALAGDDATAARAFARAAGAEFRRQSRPRWALLARQLEVRARWAGGERTGALAAAARSAASQLLAAGWQVAALHCQLVAGRVELDRRRPDAARMDLAQAAQARRRGPADLRAAAWYAEALLRSADGDNRGAAAALKAGLRVVDDHAASLGATDLRVHAAGLGAELAADGVRLAVEAGKPAAVLDWIERFRAGTLRQRAVRPPSDAKLAADLADLRRVTSELTEAIAAGHDVRPLRAAQLRLEDAIRSRSRHAAGAGKAPTAFDRAELAHALGDRALIEIFRVDDAMAAITMVDGRLRLTALGSYAATSGEQDALRFALHQLARRQGSARMRAAAADARAATSRSLDAMLIEPVRSHVGDRELVIVPTGRLHALPWPTLPSLRSRPHAVAPSATTWLAATRLALQPARRNADRVVLVAGPRLEHAHDEVQAVAALYRKPQVYTGAGATTHALCESIDGAALAHIAAHGHFRADNPQFSSLDLIDGPLTVYDLERVRRGPRLMVLSACDSGLSQVHPGDELMGLTNAVFSFGTSTLIASVVPVADDLTKALMVELHRELCLGVAPAGALAVAHDRVPADGFACFGVG